MRLVLAAAAAALLVAILSTARRADPMYPRSDEALIELATREALNGRQLVGAYSRFGWHHPGPMLFYALAPFYALSGFRTAGLNAGALAINLAAVSVIAWILIRRGGPALTMAFAAVGAVYVAQLDVLLVSSWNAHVDLLMCAAVLVLGSAAAAGWVALLPLLAAAASFVVQSHVAVLPFAAAVGAVALAPNLLDAPRRRAAAPQAAWAIGVLAMLWAPPIVEQLGHQTASGNFGRMWAFITDPGMAPAPAAETYGAWSRMLTAVWRGALTLPGLRGAEDAATWPLVAAPAEVLALVAVALWAKRRGRSFHLWLAVQSAVGAVAALAAVMQKPGEILGHEVFWITIVGVTGAAAVAGSVLGAAGGRASRNTVPGHPVALAAGVALVALVAVQGFGRMQALVARSRALDVYDLTVRDGAHAIERELTRLGVTRARVAVDQRVWDSAAGMILQLRKRGVSMAFDGRVAWMYPGAEPPDGGEDGEAHFCGGACHAEQQMRPGNVVLFEKPGVIAVDGRRVE